VSASRTPRVRLGYLASIQSGITVDGNRSDGPDDVTLPYLRVANVQDGHLDLATITEIRVPKSLARSATLKRGDVLMTEGGDLDKLGRGTVWDDEVENCLHQNHVFAVRPDPSKLLPEYLALVTQSSYARAYFESTGTKTTNLASTSSSKIRDFRIPLVGLDEQRRIADFVDAEAARIDALVKARKIQQGLVSERHTSLLVHLTTPVDLPTSPLRRIMIKLSRPIRSDDAVITAYRDGEVTLRSNRREDGYTFSDTEAGYQGVEPGDLVFHALDGFAGAVGVSDSRGKASPVYHVCGMLGDDDLRFMSFALRAMGMTGYLEVQAGNVRQRSVDFRTWEAFARLPMPRPSLREQRRIADALTESRAWSEKIAATLDQQLALLAERRQALITAAVTGGITV
jgi:type I restriction enzyme, S subunit